MGNPLTKIQQMLAPYDYMFKILLVGPVNAGKTALM
jgi:GTPase SAR1 family protein